MGRDAHDLAWPDLVWSHFSRPRHDPFDERVVAAAEAGFAGIGLYIGEYRRMREQEGRSAADIRAVVDAHGLAVAEIDALGGWSSPAGEASAECLVDERWAYEMADELGCRYLQVVGPHEGTVDDAARGFAALCDRADPHGLLVGIEWLPFTNIRTAADAQAIVERTERANAGYCADIWHHRRGADDEAMIRALPAERVFAVQMNDGVLRPTIDDGFDYRADCLASRLPPGEGEFDCVGFVRLLVEMGVTAPLSLEVCSAQLWDAPVGVAATRAAEGMRAVLADASAGRS